MRFLSARLDEDEAGSDGVHLADCACVITANEPETQPCDCGYPDRIRREVAAKLALIQRYGYCWQAGAEPGNEHLDAIAAEYEDYLFLTWTASYSDHPDYDEEWKPPPSPQPRLHRVTPEGRYEPVPASDARPS